jgi:hypothetical protein
VKVAAGFFSFTEITDPTAHRAYNEWHMLDHMPEQFPLPGVVFGQRWVLPPEHRAVAVATEPLDRVHYVTLYLMAEPLASTLDEFAALGAALHATPGRWFESRRSVLAGPWLVDDVVAAGVPIRAEAVPARPHRSLHVQIGGEVDCASRATSPGVIGVWRFGASPELASRRRGRVGTEADVVLTWCDDVGLDRFDDPHAIFAATLLPITPWQWDWFESDV